MTLVMGALSGCYRSAAWSSRIDHAPGVHQQRLQRGITDMAEATLTPLGAPAVGELEHAVAAVEADDADRVPAKKLATRFRHRDDPTSGVHEAFVHHHAGDEAVRH